MYTIPVLQVEKSKAQNGYVVCLTVTEEVEKLKPE